MCVTGAPDSPWPLQRVVHDARLTSPNYAIMASCDVSSAMMEAPSGPFLTNESIEEAIAFRQVISRMQREMLSDDDLVLLRAGSHRQCRPARTSPFHDADPVGLSRPELLGAGPR